MCFLFKQNVLGPTKIGIPQFGIVYVEHSVAAAVEEVKKTLDDDCGIPLTQIPLHEDQRNVDLVEELSSSWIRENVDLVTFDVDLHQS